MSVRDFSLKPYPSPGVPPQLTITGSVERHAGIFSITYTLAGHLAEVVVPPLSDNPVRMDGLWEETCFEFFLAKVGSESYREFNLSPSGHWNVYSFMSYRSGMQEEETFTSLPFSIVMQPESLKLTLEFALEKIMPSEQPLQIAISSVVKQEDGGVTFWALKHPGPQPDFHRRESFLIVL